MLYTQTGQVPKHTYGPLAPIQWGTTNGLTNPGLNPGFGVTPPAFYQTTDPVQSQYYWGMHPYMQTQADLPNYNTVPEAPAVPFGIQQSRQPFDVNSFIQNQMGPDFQFATQGTSPQYAGKPSYSTSYGGAAVPGQPTPAIASRISSTAQVPIPATSTYTPQNLATYLPPVTTVPQVNMNFAPVAPQPLNTLPDWAPGQLDLTQPVAPYVPYAVRTP